MGLLCVIYVPSVCMRRGMDGCGALRVIGAHACTCACVDRSRDGIDANDRSRRPSHRSIDRSFASIAPSMNARDARVRVHAPDRSRHQSTHSSNRASMAFSVTLYPHPGLFHAIFMTPRCLASMPCIDENRSFSSMPSIDENRSFSSMPSIDENR